MAYSFPLLDSYKTMSPMNTSNIAIRQDMLRCSSSSITDQITPSTVFVANIDVVLPAPMCFNPAKNKRRELPKLIMPTNAPATTISNLIFGDSVKKREIAISSVPPNIAFQPAASMTSLSKTSTLPRLLSRAQRKQATTISSTPMTS